MDGFLVRGDGVLEFGCELGDGVGEGEGLVGVGDVELFAGF